MKHAEINSRIELPNLLRHFNLPLIAAEVGVAEGFNSFDLLKAGIEKLYMVDAWETLRQIGDGGSPQGWHDKNYDAALERVKSFGNKVVILRGLSSAMAKQIPNNSLGLVYIDGDHSYTGVTADLNNYLPKLVRNGILAGHDIQNSAYGVKQAVEEFCKNNNLQWHLIPESAEHPEYASFWIQNQ